MLRAPAADEASTMSNAHAQELAHRASDGFEVSLLWTAADDALTVVVEDTKSGARFSVAAARDRALDVFYHPFAYAAPEAA